MFRVPLSAILLSCLAALPACGSMSPTSDPSTPGETSSDPDTDPASAAVLDLPDTPYNYANQALPAHFTTPFVRGMDNTPANNPTTDAGATLGRVLFYDKTLSQNGTIACASCHDQAHAFSDTTKLSTGFDGGLTARNAMPIIDARYYRDGRFFWDERAATLEDQVLMPIQSTVEMGLTLDELVAKVSAQDYYPDLFKKAFGDPAVSSDRISKALAQFVRSIISYRSRFDAGLASAVGPGQPFSNFTPQENHGKALFFGPAGCAPCHLDNGPPMPGMPPQNQAIFFINRATNNGLDADFNVADNGVGDQTDLPKDNGRFKSPSLRNVALTAPYMHDGRFATLGEVVEHYNSGVLNHPNLDPRLTVPGTAPPVPRKLNLSPADKADLIAFLGTLTDEALIADPKFKNPFVAQ